MRSHQPFLRCRRSGQVHPACPGHRPVRPCGRDSQPRTRAASGLRPAGHYGPPARSWLTTGRFSRRKRGPTLRMTAKPSSKSRGGAPKGAPARVMGRWSRPLMGPARPQGGPQVRRSAPAPFGAPPPSPLRGKRTKGVARTRQKTGGAALAFADEDMHVNRMATIYAPQEPA